MHNRQQQRLFSHAQLLSLLLLGSLASASALADDNKTLSQLADGSFIASGSGQRYLRQPQLMTRQCLQLGTQRSQAGETSAVLSNRCDYDLAVSYCVDSAAATRHRCDALVQAGSDSRRLKPRESLRIDSGLPISANYPVNFIACRQSSGVISTLTSVRHGECLSPDAHLASAQR